MEIENKNKKIVTTSDYLSVILRWKKFILINLFIIIALALIYSFLIPETYKATATLMFPESKGVSGLEAVSGMLSSVPFLSSNLIGSGSNINEMLGILESRLVKRKLIKKFNLMKYYGVDDNNLYLTLKRLDSDLDYEINQNSMLEISVIHENPNEAAKMVNFLVSMLDSLNIEFSNKEAIDNRIFIEERYHSNLKKLEVLEDSMKSFQEKYEIYSIPEQIESAINIIATLEAELVKRELIANKLKNELGDTSPDLALLNSDIDILKNRIRQIKSGNKLEFNSVILFPFKKVPEIQMKYFQLYRDIEIQGKIIEYILPLYEKAKIDENNDLPTIIVLDEAIPPDLKYAPKKALIVGSIGFVAFFALLILSFRGEASRRRQTDENLFEIKESKVYKKIAKIYRIEQ